MRTGHYLYNSSLMGSGFIQTHAHEFLDGNECKKRCDIDLIHICNAHRVDSKEYPTHFYSKIE